MAFENLDANSIIFFLVGLLISTVVIYLVTFLLGQRRSIKLAIFTAIIGSIVYGIAYILLGNGFLSAVLGGIAWLLALKSIYRMGWLKALIVAVIVWIITYCNKFLIAHSNRASLTAIQNTSSKIEGSSGLTIIILKFSYNFSN